MFWLVTDLFGKHVLTVNYFELQNTCVCSEVHFIGQKPVDIAS